MTNTCECGATCGQENEECEGPVIVVDELNWVDMDGEPDWCWVHLCEKHAEDYDG